jgi:hydroxymethylpyrimidine/phosphomethylpyrimidine kinase
MRQTNYGSHGNGCAACAAAIADDLVEATDAAEARGKGKDDVAAGIDGNAAVDGVGDATEPENVSFKIGVVGK